MSVYNVYFRNGPDNIIVDIPDIYRDCDSETNSEQLRGYLCENLNIENDSLLLDIKRGSKIIRRVQDFTIENNDELYFSIKDKKGEIDVKKLKLNVGFTNQHDMNCNLQIFSESYLKEVDNKIEEYYKKLDIVINDVKSINNNDKTDKFISDLLLNKIKYVIFPDVCPLNIVDNIWYFCHINQNGFCYDHKNKIYYEGHISGDKILYGRSLNINEQYFSYCDMFVNFKECAKGTKNFINNDNHYEGFFHEGLYSGGGSLTNEIGKYQGIFRDGKYNAYGCMIYRTGDIYIGYWYDGKYNIFGKFIDKNGDFYSGTWIDGKREIYGVLYDHVTNTTYSGTFKDDKRTFIKHQFTVLDGKQFYTDIIGEYSIELEDINEVIKHKYSNVLYEREKLLLSNYRNTNIESFNEHRQKFYIGHYDFTQNIYGFGKLFYNKDKKLIINEYNDTRIYSTEYFERKYNGFRIYHSLFNNGSPNGHGMIEFENGDKYIGDIKDGQVTGTGTIFKNDGNIVRGFWNNNKLIYSM